MKYYAFERCVVLVCLGLLGGFPCPSYGQHSMPIPTCPGRGIMAPGSDGLWYLDRCYGCPLKSETSEGCGDEEVTNHILPAFLHEYEGITAEYIYTGEVFTLAHGGFNKNAATRYRGNLDLVLTGDSEAMGLWQGGRRCLRLVSAQAQASR